MTSGSPDDVLERPSALPEAVVRYAEHEDGVIDLHLPEDTGSQERLHLVVFLHGGFWKQAYDRRHVRPLARALVAEGVAVAAPEYRRVGGSGGWPMTGDDVLAAYHLLPDLLDGLGLRADVVTVAGHSAGGHLALWLAAHAGAVDHVVGLGAVGDLTGAARDCLGDRATQALLGGDPQEVPGAYAAADPLRLLAGASPGTRISLVHGTQDDVVPVTQSRALAERYPQADLIELPCGHFEVIDPLSSVWADVSSVLVSGGGTLTS